MAILTVLVPLSVLGNSEDDDVTETDQTTCDRPFWGFGWLLRGPGWGPGAFAEAIAEKLGATDEELQEATVQVIVEDMADKLDLTEEEVEEVTPIVEQIYDLRKQLSAKIEELDVVIGDKLDAYKESMAGCRGFRGMPRMRSMRGMAWRCRCPGDLSTDEEPAE